MVNSATEPRNKQSWFVVERETQLSVQRPTEPLTLMHSECPSDRSLLAHESSTHEP